MLFVFAIIGITVVIVALLFVLTLWLCTTGLFDMIRGAVDDELFQGIIVTLCATGVIVLLVSTVCIGIYYDFRKNPAEYGYAVIEK